MNIEYTNIKSIIKMTSVIYSNVLLGPIEKYHPQVSSSIHLHKLITRETSPVPKCSSISLSRNLQSFNDVVDHKEMSFTILC